MWFFNFNLVLTWQHTKKINKVIAVHKTFSLNWICLSGFAISGKTEQKGLITSKNLTKRKKEKFLA